jgi:hypothetical protein
MCEARISTLLTQGSSKCSWLGNLLFESAADLHYLVFTAAPTLLPLPISSQCEHKGACTHKKQLVPTLLQGENCSLLSKSREWAAGKSFSHPIFVLAASNIFLHAIGDF